MKTKYKLSVIVPAYNAEKIIEDCLNQILRETKKIVCEIIVAVFLCNSYISTH